MSEQNEIDANGPVVPVPDDVLTKAYGAAMRVAEQWGRKRPDISEELIDAATSAVLWARGNCRCVATFPGLCSRAVRTWLRRQSHREKLKRENRPEMTSLSAEMDRARVAKPGQPMLIDDLPEDLAFLVRLYTVDGFTCREIGLLTGRSHSTVNVMLHKAAELLAPGRVKPLRGNGEKRLSAG